MSVNKCGRYKNNVSDCGKRGLEGVGFNLPPERDHDIGGKL